MFSQTKQSESICNQRFTNLSEDNHSQAVAQCYSGTVSLQGQLAFNKITFRKINGIPGKLN